MNFRDPRKKRPEASLDMTPLIDVVFLLLVFFLLTTFLRPQPTQESSQQEEAVIDIQFATAASGHAETAAEKVTVFLDTEGLLYLDSDTPVPPNVLKQRLLDLLGAGKQPVVDLKADKRASHGSVIELLDLIKETGVETVNIVIKKSE
jgi:biopolymer transport protein ExbD